METMCEPNREEPLASRLRHIRRLEGAARLAALWEMSQPLVVIAARRRRMSPEAIEDATQAWFIALAEAEEARRLPVESPHSLRKAIGRFLERRQRQERATQRASRLPMPPPRPVPGPDATAHARAAALRARIEALPDVYRAVLFYCLDESPKPADLAAQLGISPSAARKRLCRARKALRTRLQEDPM